MRPLELNLATRPYRNNTLVWLAYVGLFVAASGFTYWNVSSFRHYGQELGDLDLHQGNMKQEQDDLQQRHLKVLNGVKKFDRTLIGRRTSKANEVIDWRAFSWTRLFNRLEDMLPYGIKMTSIRPIFRGRDRQDEALDSRPSMLVKVEGVARDWDSFFKLETDLIENQSFGRVLPRGIDKMPNGELSFSIEFAYFPGDPLPAPEEPLVEEVAQDDAKTPSPGEATDTAVEQATGGDPTRKLPAADSDAAEVTDDWAQTGSEAAGENKPDEGAGAVKTTSAPTRRALPKAQPEPADDEGERR
jgi:hypothetical protein